MSNMQNELRAKAKELLESGQVTLVIGYEAASVPFRSTPLFAGTAEDAEKLIWNPTCVNNLTAYLPQAAKKGKVAVIVKPCDAKSVIELAKEHQIERESVIVIVASCQGVLGQDALKSINLKEVRSIDWKGEGIAVSTGSGEKSVEREKAFQGKCLTCDIVEPTTADVKIGTFGPRQPLGGRFASVEEYEKLSFDERREFWAAQFEHCIRCYACRQVCPGCYCKECFVDKNGQLWASKATDTTSNWFFHVTRVMHLAGRCTGCGECERACPMNIPLSLMSKRMAMDVAEMFDCKPGSDPEAAPALGVYTMNDPDPCPE